MPKINTSEVDEIINQLRDLVTLKDEQDLNKFGMWLQQNPNPAPMDTTVPVMRPSSSEDAQAYVPERMTMSDIMRAVGRGENIKPIEEQVLPPEPTNMEEIGTTNLSEILAGSSFTPTKEVKTLGKMAGEFALPVGEGMVTEDTSDKIPEEPPEREFQIGQVVVNKNTGLQGVIIDETLSGKYVVKWDNTPGEDIVSKEDLTFPENVAKPLPEMIVEQQATTELPTTQEEKEKEEKEQKEDISEDLKKALKEVLTDPRVAPVIVESLLEKGLLPDEVFKDVINPTPHKSSIVAQTLLSKLKGGE